MGGPARRLISESNLDCSYKLYITHNEWATEYGGAKKKEGPSFQALPHDYCSLTFAPFVTPVCSPSGQVFDLLHIMNHLDKCEKSPVTGEPLKAADLIKLEYSRNAAGELYCPITLKTFSDFSHIIAVKRTGRVYSAEGLAQLDDGKSYHDFFTDEGFTKDDLITLQDPRRVEGRNINEFRHVKETRAVADKKPKLGENSTATNATQTSTIAMERSVSSPKQSEDMETQMFQSVRVSGKATIRTNLGDLHIELHCHKVPKTCYNFIQLARRGYYEGIKFHRLLPGFIVQGGDPTGTGAGGESCWGGTFENEFSPTLKHNARGVLSMANKGRSKTNTSQFFITFAEAPHLDRIHPVFGRVIDGWGTLDKIEQSSVDSAARPVDPIVIHDIIVVIDPFEMYQQEQAKTTAKRPKSELDPTMIVRRAKTTINTHTTIGKYIKKST